MNRDEIISTTGCPKCGVKAFQPCVKNDGARRPKSHVERLYRAQDIEAGKPDRTTGKVNRDFRANCQCPKCKKLLKSEHGVVRHMIDAHGLDRPSIKALRREYIKSQEFKTSAPKPTEVDDIDLMDDTDAF